MAASRPETWLEAEAMAEAALRQRDAEDRAAHPTRHSPSVNRDRWTERWLETNTDHQRLLDEHIGEDVASFRHVEFSTRIIAEIRAPWTPGGVIGAVHRIFSSATPHDEDIFPDAQDYTEYVRQRIPVALLRAGAAVPNIQWQGSAWNAPVIRQALRAGFAERFVVERSNVTAHLSHRFGTPVATLVTMFLSARIDQTPEGRVPQRPMVQRYFPPEPAPAAAASSNNRRRGAGDDPAGHVGKKGKGPE